MINDLYAEHDQLLAAERAAWERRQQAVLTAPGRNFGGLADDPSDIADQQWKKADQAFSEFVANTNR